MDRETRRKHILACARDCFGEKGYHATTIADIIKRADIARGTFYLYFDNKRAIFEELLDNFFILIRQAVLRVDMSDSSHTPRMQLRGNVVRILNVLTENTALSRILLSEAVGLDEGFDDKLRAFYGQLLDLIEGSLELGQKMGIIRQCEPRMVAICILGTVKEITYQHLAATEAPSVDMLADEILNFALEGIYTGPPDKIL